MQEIDDVTTEVRAKQAQQRRSLERGAEKMDLARERIRKRSEALKKPRNRNLDKNRLQAALREMSKDLERLEKGFERMLKRDEDVSDMLDKRRDLLLRDCFRLKRLVDSRRIFEDVKRVRTLGEPVGGRRVDSTLPSWVPGRN